MSGTLSSPNGWMEKLTNIATEIEEIDMDFAKTDKALAITISRTVHEGQ